MKPLVTRPPPAYTQVKIALGVDQKRGWQDCNRVVTLGFELSGDWLADVRWARSYAQDGADFSH
eukprot:scaffold26384_cov36-Tisochrysis_lutea.AAC.9